MARCREIHSYSDLSFDTVDQMPTEEAIICLLKQIRFLLIKLSNSVAPAIDITRVKNIGTKAERIYRATSTKTVEIQNISHLTENPNDLILQPKIKDSSAFGLVVRPAQTVRVFIEAGSSIWGQFKDKPSYIVVSEIL